MLTRALVCLVLVTLSKATTDDTERIKALEKSLKQALVENGQLRGRLSEMEQRCKRQPAVSNDLVVGFTAYVGGQNLSNIGAFETIVFDTLTSNIGFGYDLATGIFSAPVAGVYVFSVDITVDAVNFANLHIIRAPASGEYSVDVANLLADSSTINNNSTGSRTIVLSLDVGDQVWVRNGLARITELHGEGFSSFTGFLLGSYTP